MRNSIRIGDKVMGIMGVTGGYAGTVTAIKRDGRHTVVFFVDDDGAEYETLDSNITKNVPPKGKFPRLNPAARIGMQDTDGTRPQVGRYTSFKKWVDAVRSLGKQPQSDSPVPQVVYGPFNIVSEWNGKSGTINEYFDYNPLVRRKGESERDFMARCMSQEKKSFPKQKQRVAVCLSKSRRNSYYDRNLDS